MFNTTLSNINLGLLVLGLIVPYNLVMTAWVGGIKAAQPISKLMTALAHTILGQAFG